MGLASTKETTKKIKRSPKVLFLMVIIFIGFMACKTDDNIVGHRTEIEIIDSSMTDSKNSRLRIKIGSKEFTATLLNNTTATAFKARLPMTVVMNELNGNEKLHNFSSNLPANASNPRTIQTGDLMLYGSNTLVLFYKTFSTPYSYTRLGHIDDVSGLAEAAGTGNVTVTFKLEHGE
jgi:hypothetical protein